MLNGASSAPFVKSIIFCSTLFLFCRIKMFFVLGNCDLPFYWFICNLLLYKYIKANDECLSAVFFIFLWRVQRKLLLHGAEDNFTTSDKISTHESPEKIVFEKVAKKNRKWLRFYALVFLTFLNNNSVLSY